MKYILSFLSDCYNFLTGYGLSCYLLSYFTWNESDIPETVKNITKSF